MSLPRVVVFGEALTDIVQTTPGHWCGYPGGAPWNVARTLGNLGIATAFAGAISENSLGDEIFQQSERAGLDLRFLQRVNADPLVAIVASSQPPHYFFGGEADLHFDALSLPEGWLEAVELCHFSCISLAREPLATQLLDIAHQAHAAGKIISYDPNWRNVMTDEYRCEVFPKMVKLASIIKLSDEDLRHLYPGASEQEAIQALRGLNPKAEYLFTRGERGLVLHGLEGDVEQKAIEVQVADTVGAGDACMAGWLASLLFGMAPTGERLRFAAACASASCRQPGAYSPSLSEVLQLAA